MGRYTPSLWGMSGVVTVVRKATYTQVAVLAMGELEGPVTWGLEPAKSTRASSPSMVMATLMSMGSSVKPSESRVASPWYTPSGSFSISARIRLSAYMWMSSMVSRVLASPYLPIISIMRFSPTRQEATWAFMSTHRSSGIRVLMRIMSITSWMGLSSL